MVANGGVGGLRLVLGLRSLVVFFVFFFFLSFLVFFGEKTRQFLSFPSFGRKKEVIFVGE